MDYAPQNGSDAQYKTTYHWQWELAQGISERRVIKESNWAQHVKDVEEEKN